MDGPFMEGVVWQACLTGTKTVNDWLCCRASNLEWGQIQDTYSWLLPSFEIRTQDSWRQTAEIFSMGVVAALYVDCDLFSWRMGTLQVDLQAVTVAWYLFYHADPSQLTEAERDTWRLVYMSSQISVFGQYLRSRVRTAEEREIWRLWSVITALDGWFHH